MFHLLRTAGRLAALSATLVLAACGASSPTSPKIDPGLLPGMDLMLAEKSMGSSAARHTIVELGSFTCPHCADFETITLPQLKAAYVDTGMARFVFRNSPRDLDLDLTASMLARCAGDRYFDAVAVIFAKQGTWAGASNTGPLEAVMREFGMSQGVIDACKASTALKDGILRMKQEALQQYNYQYVPTFVIDGTVAFYGNQPVSAFEPYLR